MKIINETSSSFPSISLQQCHHKTDPTQVPPPRDTNPKPLRLNIPEDSPSLPSQSPETLSQKGSRLSTERRPTKAE